MLPDENGKPMIRWALDIAINPLVITRAEKKDLIEYLNENGVQYMIVEPTKEWPDTILSSKNYWRKRNILLLPDTRFKPAFPTIDKLNHLLFNNKVVTACHRVKDQNNWGIVKERKIYEKPDFDGEGLAWGLIAFQRSAGGVLFSDLLNDGVTFIDTELILMLDEFKDLTR
jgi:hypothetical protein